VRAIAWSKLEDLRTWLDSQIPSAGNADQTAHFRYGLAQIIRFQTDPAGVKITPPLSPPPGAPIG
jgi:hypothetical protein